LSVYRTIGSEERSAEGFAERSAAGLADEPTERIAG